MFIRLAITCAYIALFTTSLFAQAVIRYAEPGYITISVSLWGDIRTPGRYEVKEGTDLLELLTIAGGPTGISTTVEREVEHIFVKISREFPEGRRLFFEHDLNKIIEQGEAYPQLKTGDIVVVKVEPKSRGINWRNIGIMVSTFSSLIILGLNIKKIL